jgi:hypothetical protein
MDGWMNNIDCYVETKLIDKMKRDVYESLISMFVVVVVA